MRRPAIAKLDLFSKSFADGEPGWIIAFLVDHEGNIFALFEHGDGRISEKLLSEVRFTDWERD